MQNMTQIFKFNLPELNLNPADVNRVLGGTDTGRELTRVLFRELVSEIAHAEGICGGYRRFNPVQLNDDSTLKIASENFDVGSRIARQLQDIEQAAVFVATAGSGITDWAQQWLQLDPLKGVIADTIASLIPEAVVQNIQRIVDAEVQVSGHSLSNAYNPGYCDWPVSDQRRLFSLLPDRFCGVTLNEHAQMLPLKSVSGVIGIGKHIQYLDAVCALCERLNCAYRKPAEHSGLST